MKSKDIELMLSAHSHILLPETMDAELLEDVNEQVDHPLFIG